ncbi:pyruvate, phosphate dikinase [Candidatus Margulisiibacteriota bacterium]
MEQTTATTTKKNVYFFGNGEADGNATMRQLLGGKGCNLAEMTNIGVPVPPGFTITTEVCKQFYDNNKQYPGGLQAEINDNVAKLEETMGAKFGDKESPLLVSVRSGAAVSLPGMMDTVLNLGLNDETVEALGTKTGNPRFAWDSYRRFIQMFSNVVMDVSGENFEHAIDAMKKKKGVQNDTELTVDDLKELVDEYKKIVKEKTGELFPNEPIAQLEKSINAVFGSWNNERAITYRRLNDIRGLIGTAVNVQAMVYGNMGDTSGTGVCFSRNPATGENKFYGEYLINAQGEDVVAGVRTPETIDKLEPIMPDVYKELVEIYLNLEKHFKDMQDMEFTIQEGKLYFLQTRTGKRTAVAALKIAVDMEKEGLIDEKTALLRIDPNQLDQLLHPTFDPKAERKVIAKGLNASPGAAVGKVVFSAEDAVRLKEMGEKTILVRIETSPEDIAGMDAARGILTARGGATSHAAVVARGMGKCCVAGCSGISIDYAAKQFNAGDVVIKEGDWISLDGTTGEVMDGQVKTIDPELGGEFNDLMVWADKYRTMKVRTNADTPKDSEVARKFGAEGIGLCRTEHMFFEGNRIDAVREMILAEDVEGREKALAKLLPIQKGDFVGIFQAMAGLPVTIRLLDPPLHEFLPHQDSEVEALAKDMGVSFDVLKKRVSALHEFNPMLGHRGCRLGITYPEIYDMQVRAIIQAAIDIKKSGQDIVPEIMIPLVGHVKELSILKENAIKVIKAEMASAGVELEYMIGTMIEVPRAALTADEVAAEAEFFSFGTNDLTQMTCGFSRDDSGSFLPEYVEKGIYERDPFQALDQTGVGSLMKISIEKGKQVRPDIKLGICGEHGGEPSSVEFCYKAGLDYVSCSPFRVPIARLVAAQSAIKS